MVPPIIKATFIVLQHFDLQQSRAAKLTMYPGIGFCAATLLAHRGTSHRNYIAIRPATCIVSAAGNRAG